MYYSVKLNVPPSKADAIKSLVPEGEPVSGTLVGLLLDLASERGYEPAVPSTDAAWTRKVARLESRVKKLESRLDYLLSGRGSR